MDILVVGSYVTDLVVTTEKMPYPGETVLGNTFSVYPGGKGANQAVAASRLGAKVSMSGKVGDDANGKMMIDTMKEEHVDISHTYIEKNMTTGVGSITIDSSGQNRIVVVPGANMTYQKEELEHLDTQLRDVDMVMCQLEIPYETVMAVADKCYDNQVPFLLNPAPASVLNDRLLSRVDFLTPNETEIEILTGRTCKTTQDVVDASKELICKGVKNVIVTLGSKGALIVNKDMVKVIKGYPVEAIDTVAAGDCFNGAFAAATTKGLSIEEAVRYANGAAALSVTKNGAIPSLPNSEDVKALTGGDLC
ncbi:ribokinase [Acidaminobacter sp. JC074]|uniref:ribokinase n=1 Tax=Acidaminobacter sp. JC074 TaxID=2530199 RepID=UPI001F0D65BB|nr:ribokinase [Acidaminobacter sp. JC074]MCH4886573.1 ribokinase [Acidaminobacter sp. JC074]